jgi:hypothetical protein
MGELCPNGIFSVRIVACWRFLRNFDEILKKGLDARAAVCYTIIVTLVCARGLPQLGFASGEHIRLVLYSCVEGRAMCSMPTGALCPSAFFNFL